MRGVIVGLCMVLAGASLADAQPNSDTYILVDSSSSMAQGSNWSDAVGAVDDQIAALKRERPKSFVRISQFNGNSKDSCATPIVLGARATLEAATWEKRSPVGTTLLGAALRKA